MFHVLFTYLRDVELKGNVIWENENRYETIGGEGEKNFAL